MLLLAAGIVVSLFALTILVRLALVFSDRGRHGAAGVKLAREYHLPIS